MCVSKQFFLYETKILYGSNVADNEKSLNLGFLQKTDKKFYCDRKVIHITDLIHLAVSLLIGDLKPISSQGCFHFKQKLNAYICGNVDTLRKWEC